MDLMRCSIPLSETNSQLEPRSVSAQEAEAARAERLGQVGNEMRRFAVPIHAAASDAQASDPASRTNGAGRPANRQVTGSYQGPVVQVVPKWDVLRSLAIRAGF